jgi:hypothetical protein
VTHKVVGTVQMYKNIYFSMLDSKPYWYVTRPWNDCRNTKEKNAWVDLRRLVTLQAPGT